MSSIAPAPKRAASGPDDANVHRPARWPSTTSDAAFGCGLAALFVLVAFVTTGGTDLGPNSWMEIAAVLLAAAAAAAVIVIGAPGRAWGGVTLLLFAALAALTFASIAWSVQPDNSWVEANRTLSYLAAFATALALARLLPERWPAVLGAVATAATVICAWAILVKVFPASLDVNDPAARLSAPFDYWNATGLLAAMGLAPCIWAGARPSRGHILRALSVPAVAILIGVVVLSYSRGAVIAAIVACGCWFAITPLRLRAALIVGLGAAGGAVISVWALLHHALTHYDATLAARTAAGHTFGIVALVVVLLLAPAGYAAAVAMDRFGLEPRSRHRIGVALIAALSLIPIGGIVFMATSSRGLTGEASHVWTSLTNTKGVVAETPGRLVDLSNSRPRYWREGLKIGEHNLLKGTGAGGFQTARTRYTSDLLIAGHAHSYVMETFADFGLIGTLISLALLISWAIATGRTLGVRGERAPPVMSEHRAERTGMFTMLAVVIAFGIHSAIDWTWFFPGVAIPALACAGWLAGRGPLSAPVGRRSQPRRLLAAPAAGGALVAIVAIALGAAWVIWQPLRSANADASAVAALLAGHTRKALDDAHTAASTDPVSANALWELSEIDLAVGNRAGAREDLARAASRQPDNPETWQRLGEFDLRHGRPGTAVGELERAGSLDLTAGQPYRDVADAYTKLGRLNQARHALAEAIVREPGNPDSWVQVGRLDLQSGAAAVALHEFQEARLLGSAEAVQLAAKAQSAVNAQHARAAAAAKTAAHRQRAR